MVGKERRAGFATILALLIVLVSGSLSVPISAAGQDSPSDEQQAADIVVTARKASAPIWTITRDNSTLIIVGEIRAIPDATPWRPESLEAAVARSNRVLLPLTADVSIGDVLRLIFKGKALMRLPKETTAATYLPADQAARLIAIDKDYAKQSFFFTTFQLLTDKLKFRRNTGREVRNIVRSAADRAHIVATPVGRLRGKDLIDDLMTIDPATQVPCIIAAMDAVDAGPDGLVDRGKAWTQRQVPAVMASPLERALGLCWPWGDPELGPDLRARWIAAIDQSLSQPGVTMAVVPLQVLAERDGVLDALERRSVAIVGPAWKTR